MARHQSRSTLVNQVHVVASTYAPQEQGLQVHLPHPQQQLLVFIGFLLIDAVILDLILKSSNGADRTDQDLKPNPRLFCLKVVQLVIKFQAPRGEGLVDFQQARKFRKHP